MFAEKSKEYSDINEIIDIAKKYISFGNDKRARENFRRANFRSWAKKMAEIELIDLKSQNETNEKIKIIFVTKDGVDKKMLLLK